MKKHLLSIITLIFFFAVLAIYNYGDSFIDGGGKDSGSIIPGDNTSSLDKKIHEYLEKEYSHGYYCDALSGSKYFFDSRIFPYQHTGTYLVSFGVIGYSKTSGGNITKCGGGGELIVVNETLSGISLVHKFPEFGELPKEIAELLQKSPQKETTYEQAKKYFNSNSNENFYKECPQKLCNKVRYSVIETGDNLNDEIQLYTTEVPQEIVENGGRRSMNFSGDYTMTETHRGCSDSERCSNTGTRKHINENTIEYPIPGEKTRTQQFEIIDLSETIIKIRHIWK